MRIVKVSQPQEWENKINMASPHEEGIWGEFKFILTREKIECDYWVVLGDLPGTEEAICPEENLIYITDEAHTEKRYNKEFLGQFAAVITSREDIAHKKLILAPYTCAWGLKKNFDFLASLEPTPKNKMMVLSAVCSDSTLLEGHKKRFAFINKMIGHFKSRLDIYGRGLNEIDDKFYALINYQYSIAIENSHLPRYFSEKIADCFLTYTMPVYYGCSNILDYYPEESMVLIDLTNFMESIDKIEEAIKTNRLVKNFDYLVDARNIYLKKYHPLKSIILELEEHFEANKNKKKQLLKSMKTYDATDQKNSGLFKR